jgi:hypothetical protein
MTANEKAPAQVFTLESWFRDGRLDGWDCDNEYLVIVDGRIETRQHGSGATYWRDKVQEEFPGAVWHKEALSLHRGLIEPRGLEGLDEPTLALLRTKFKFKE